MRVGGAELLEHNGPRARYAFDRQILGTSDLTGRLSQRYAVRDIAVQEPEVEETVRSIYERKSLAQV